MTREQAEAALAELGKVDDDHFPLFEAALLCALHEDPLRDPDAARRLMDHAAERLAERLKRESPEEALAETMAGDLRLNGDVLSYEDPANADLISVLERRAAPR